MPLVLSLSLEKVGQIVDASQCVWMLHSQHLQCSSTHLLRLLILSLISKHPCQIVDAGQCGRMLHLVALSPFLCVREEVEVG